MEFNHIPIMTREILELLDIKADGIYVDCTLGGGGHAKLIAEKLNKSGRLIGIDQDEEAIEAAKINLAKYLDKVTFVKNNFENLSDILAELNIEKVDGILIDLGVSTYQILNPDRGFSFKEDEENLERPLDMRMDTNQILDAYSVVNFYSEMDLTKILYEYGEEKFARNIVREIVKTRKVHKISNIGALLRVIKAATPPGYRFNKKPGQWASNTFRAIRMEVNNELDVIHKVLPQAIEALNPSGRIAVLTFQSLEDRIVKTFFKDLSLEKSVSPISRETIPATVKLITRKPLTPSEEEIKLNPRSNCSKLRVAEKL